MERFPKWEGKPMWIGHSCPLILTLLSRHEREGHDFQSCR